MICQRLVARPGEPGDATRAASIEVTISAESDGTEASSSHSGDSVTAVVCVYDATTIDGRPDIYPPSEVRRLQRQLEDLQRARETAGVKGDSAPLVRLLAHMATFDNSPEPQIFLKIYNDSLRNMVRIEDVWFETDPIRRVENPQRPLPTDLDPGDLFETWKPLRDLPAAGDILTRGRARLGDGSIVHSMHNVDVPPAGFVGGRGRPLDEVHVSEGSQAWDVFISYATEDRADVAKPLADVLESYGLRVWLDVLSLGIGDSLRGGIDQGIARSGFAVVIVSPSYIAKPWTNYEFEGIVNMTIDGQQALLPIWHRITKAEVRSFSPSLVGKIARLTSDLTIAEIGEEIAQRVHPDVVGR